MKKHLSVLQFYARNKIYRVLPVLLAMSVVSVLGFSALGFLNAPVLGGNHGDRFLAVVCLLGYLGCVLSCTEFPSAKSKSGYTLQRLRITEREALLWDCLTCILVFLAFYGTQLIILWAVARQYAAAPGYPQGPQGIAAAFYRNHYLHGMVPLEERGLWTRNLIYMVVTGTECACSSLDMRYSRKVFSAGFCLSAAVALQIPAELGRENYIFPLLITTAAVISLVRSLIRAHGGKRRADNEAA